MSFRLVPADGFSWHVFDDDDPDVFVRVLGTPAAAYVTAQRLVALDGMAVTVDRQVKSIGGLTLSDVDASHVGEILIKDREYTSYSCQLLRLCAKADARQLEVLRLMYPSHVAAFQAWQMGPTS